MDGCSGRRPKPGRCLRRTPDRESPAECDHRPARRPSSRPRFGFAAEVPLTARGADARALIVTIAGHVVDALPGVVADVPLDVAVCPDHVQRRGERPGWLSRGRLGSQTSADRPGANPMEERTLLATLRALRHATPPRPRTRSSDACRHRRPCRADDDKQLSMFTASRGARIKRLRTVSRFSGSSDR